MSFGFAENNTSVRVRLSPEMNMRKASSRNLSHNTFDTDALSGVGLGYGYNLA